MYIIGYNNISWRSHDHPRPPFLNLRGREPPGLTPMRDTETETETEIGTDTGRQRYRQKETERGERDVSFGSEDDYGHQKIH